MRILHVLANSPPDVNGYAIRTHGLMKAYAELENLEVLGLTSPWYPDRDGMVEQLEMDGINYHRCLHPARMKSVKGSGMKWSASRGRNRIAGSEGFANKPIWKRAISLMLKPLRPGWTWVEENILFKHFTERIIELAKSESVDIIHAHVPYRVGIPSLRAARELRLPFVYEMRGMWEESAVASGRWKPGGLAHRRFRKMETKVLKAADSVICISETLRQEAISRGVLEDKISVVPNAVDIETHREESELFNLMKEELQGLPVVGYIGSLRELEGVDLTAKAVSILKEQGVDVNFFVLSSESGQAELRDYCQSLGIADKSHIVGPVPHQQVAPFYDLIDVFVVSRPDTRVARLVTPLKPFEAMRSGRAVVMSDLPALAEIIEDGKTGCLYPAGDAQALSNAIHELLDDDSKRVEIGNNARSWITKNRTWNSVTEKMIEVYDNVVAYKSLIEK
jgi:glycosyltransferase involved in cell wall biosynthesis